MKDLIHHGKSINVQQQQRWLRSDKNPANVYLMRLSRSSRRTMQNALDHIAQKIGYGMAQEVNWWDLDYQHTAAIRTWLVESYSPSTANRYLSALRGVLEECWRLGYISAETFHRVTDLKNARSDHHVTGRGLTPSEIGDLFATCVPPEKPVDKRDAAILALMITCGLRRREVAELNIDNFTASLGELEVRGKGNRWRMTYVVNQTMDLLATWVVERGCEPGPMFTRAYKGGKISPNQGISPQAVYNMIMQRGKQAGLEHFTPHDLRRTFISNLLEKDVDLATVADLAGHANVNTTKRYDRRPEKARRTAVERLNLPI